MSKKIKSMQQTPFMFLIQGVFFKKDSSPGIATARMAAHRSDPSSRLFPYMSQDYSKNHFSGMISFDTDPKIPKTVGIGVLNDRIGLSDLSEVELRDNKLIFVMKYEDREGLIICKLETRDNVWIGTYESESNERGQIKCLLVPITSDFFEPLAHVSTH